MNKKLISLLLVFGVLFTGLLFAEAPSTKLTDSDVKNFCKNFDSIESEIEAIPGISADSLENLSKKDKAKVEAILNKYGVKGPDAVGKMNMIFNCYGIIVADNEIAKDPEAAMYMQLLGIDVFAEIRAKTNSKDMAVVKKNIPLIEEVFVKLDIDDAGDEDFDYDNKYEQQSVEDFMMAMYKDGWEEKIANGKVIKDLYEALLKTSKTPVRLSKTLDKKNASKYKKVDVVYLDPDTYADNCLFVRAEYTGADYNCYLKFLVDEKMETLTIKASYYDMSLEDFAAGKNSPVVKTKVYNIAALEGYKVSVDSNCIDYVIKTREGPAFSFYSGYDYSVDKIVEAVSVPGKKDPLNVYMTFFEYY